MTGLFKFQFAGKAGRKEECTKEFTVLLPSRQNPLLAEVLLLIFPFQVIY
jgi:hypothetical protein